MDHEAVLNLILANSCPVGDVRKDDVRRFEYDLHCAYIYIVARLKSNTGYEIQFDILYYDVVYGDASVVAAERCRKFMETL